MITLTLFSCESKKSMESLSGTTFPVAGTWILVSGTTIEKGDTQHVDYTKNQTFIKIINETHFSFLRHDLKKGKDSIFNIFASGGGKYTLKGDQYTEHLEYCNYREWEGHSFDFTITLQNDTLTQKGIEKIDSLGIDRVNIEKYVRSK